MSKRRHRRLRRRAGAAGLRPYVLLAAVAVAAVLALRSSVLGSGPPVPQLTVRTLAQAADPAVAGDLVPGIHGYALTLNGATVLSSRQGTVMYPIASTTKIMTATVALQYLRLSDLVHVTPADLQTTYAQAIIGGEEMPIQAGEVLTVRQVLDAMLLPSANNAAVLLAERTAGSQSAFVRMMNREARRLGMLHTHYADASGLSALSESSAIDLSRLAAYALTIPAFARAVTSQTAMVPLWQRVTNLNRLLWTYPGALGVKTGYTDQAGNCLVFAARRRVDGVAVTLVGALLGEPSTQQMFADATQLLDDGFAAATPAVVLTPGQVLGVMRSPASRAVTAHLVVTQPLSLAPYQQSVPLSLRLGRNRARHAPTPWQVEVRTPSGSVLATVPVRAVPVRSPAP